MSTALLWFRRDLRLTDNPALQAALAHGSRLLPVYIHAPEEEAPWQPGAASRWWLDLSLQRLDLSLRRLGSRLILRRGESHETLQELCTRHRVTHVFWNRCYEPASRQRDTRIKSTLRAQGIPCSSHNAALLFEPWQIRTAQDAPYRVFSAFWRNCLQAGLTDFQLVAEPASLPAPPDGADSIALDELGLRPAFPWDDGLQQQWQPGEAGALRRLSRFLDEAVTDYGYRRDLPGEPGTSALSPHLHFGEIGPRQILRGLLARGAVEFTLKDGSGAAVFARELGWREFAHHLLHHFPHTPEHPLDTRFNHFPWQGEDAARDRFSRWRQGSTGIPIVDAGMRELWRTGWMHNRVRMVAASFLTKNLGIHWLAGARWFWDTLVDADLANNTLGWQWTAGCGADAAPFFRIFNPLRQSERFDPVGTYLRRWLPELAALPDALLHAPWLADPQQLRRVGVRLGRDYPLPLVDLKLSRQQALKGWEAIRHIDTPPVND